MSRRAKAFTLFYWIYMLVYLLFIIGMGISGKLEESIFPYLVPFHLFGMVIGIPMLIILFQDIYAREFPNPNTKVTWTILMLMFWPSIPFYLYRHGFRRREVVPEI